jgi:glucose-6-phosphate isomerase
LKARNGWGMIAVMMKDNQKTFKKLEALAKKGPPSTTEIHQRLNDLDMMSRYVITLDDLRADFARQSVTDDVWDALIDWGHNILPRRDAMLNGEIVNPSENRPVLHTWLRDPEKDIAEENIATMSEMVERILALGVEDVIAIGIGGSYLGPAMVIEALAPFQQGPEIHFVSNIDPSHLDDVLAVLNPVTTAVIGMSKTFTTLETSVNLDEARRWLERNGVPSEDRCFAVTADFDKAVEAGIYAENVLKLDMGIGGRFSLWSAIGLPIMVAQGKESFIDMLAGAEQMDKHFAHAPVAENMPILAALIRIWNTCFLNRLSHAIVPYDNRLAMLPSWLQQLEMESNGKGHDINGDPVEITTAPFVFGEPGSNAQHSFFQMFHQSREITPADFIAPLNPITILPDPEGRFVGRRHRQLIAQMMAQADTLAIGRTVNGVAASDFPGGRPSTVMTWEQTTPFSLGRILAFYEHVTVSVGWLLNLNSFDQPGVELGKNIAKSYIGYLDQNDGENFTNRSVPKGTKIILDRLKK